ncbi:MAG: Ku protein [Betaproteobacteria bacterium]
MATASRALWKGAISFGLVHIPVALHSATREAGLDFDWLDKRSMDPVGYKRINKKTGEEIGKENIVKGLAYEKEHYVILSDEEIKAALPKSTQTIEIESFVAAGEIPLVYFERPYYLVPVGKGQKVYALLRETLKRAERVGVARVVIQTKQHLAVLLPKGRALQLILLRWASEIRSADDLDLPAEDAKTVGLNERELDMAMRLVDDLAAPWEPEKFEDSFAADVMALVEQKVQAGETKTVFQPEVAPEGTADVIDLTELLRRSLRGDEAGTAKPANAPAASRTADKPATKPVAKGNVKAGTKSAAKPAADKTPPEKAPPKRRRA